jgi:membrane protease YdiL (CAAX protease family)
MLPAFYRSAWLALAVAFAWYLGAAVAAAAVHVLSEWRPASGPARGALVNLVFLAVLMLPLWRARIWRALRAGPVRRLWLVPLVVAAVIGVNLLLARAGFLPHGQAVLSPGGPVWGAAEAGLVALAAPVVEELFFRQWLWDRLRASWQPAATGIATALAFALGHGEFALATLPLAAGLTLLRLQSGGVLVPMLAHVLQNALTIAVAFAVAG